MGEAYEELRDAFVREIELAERATSTTSQNRGAMKVLALRQSLCLSAEGRQALTELLTHRSAPVRLGAALGVVVWDRPLAMAVIAELQGNDDANVAWEATMCLQELANPDSPLSQASPSWQGA